jgi:hypothetical protein
MTGFIYTDNGADRGSRTRYFRNCPTGTGVEWIFAVDEAAGSTRWYGYGMKPNNSIGKMIKGGFPLEHVLITQPADT